MYRLIPILLLVACHHEIVTPQCDFIQASREGERIRIKIDSEEPRIAMCRELGDGTVCMNLTPNFYNCISFRGGAGDVIRFTSESCDCEIVIK